MLRQAKGNPKAILALPVDKELMKELSLEEIKVLRTADPKPEKPVNTGYYIITIV
jgi:hypothetical protein